MKKIASIIVLTIISVIFIFYRFVDIPKYLSFDEVEFTKLALSLQNKPYTPYSTLATGHSTLYFYILLMSLKLFGTTTFALRLPAAIFGVLSIIIFYLIARLSFRAIARNLVLFPFLLTFILLSSRWFLNFARFSFEATFLLFLELMSIYFLLKADAKMVNFFATLDPANAGRLQRSQKNLTSSVSLSFYLIISGLFAGLAFISYTPGRIFFLLPLLFLTLKSLRTLKLYELVYFLIPFIIIITPLTLYLLTNKETRVDQQFFLRNNEMTVNEKVGGLWSNISSTTLMLFTKGDMNGRHNYPGKPALNPILGILFIIGLTIAIKNWKNPINSFSTFYLLLSILPSLLTYPWENPNMLRTYTVLPSIVFFIGLAIYEIFKITKQKYLWLIIIIITLSSVYELRTYFKYQSKVFYDSFEIKWPLDKAIKLKNPYEKVL